MGLLHGGRGPGESPGLAAGAHGPPDPTCPPSLLGKSNQGSLYSHCNMKIAPETSECNCGYLQLRAPCRSKAPERLTAEVCVRGRPGPQGSRRTADWCFCQWHGKWPCGQRRGAGISQTAAPDLASKVILGFQQQQRQHREGAHCHPSSSCLTLLSCQ